MTVSKANKHDGERQCIVTRQSGSKESLLRFVRSPEGKLVPDLAEKLPGRGIWVTCRQTEVRKAMQGKLFAKAAKQALVVPEGLDQVVASLLYQRVVQSLSLARKAGLAVAGTEKILTCLAKGEVIALLHASDAAQEGRKKLPVPQGCVVSDVFGRDDLCQVMGKDNLAHVAVLHGSAGQFFLETLRRFTGFMEDAPL